MGDDFNVQDLVATARAFATAGESDVQLFGALARAAQWFAADFNTCELANTVRAFAMAGQSDAHLFSALAEVAERCMDDFNEQDLFMMSWALSRHENLQDAWNLFAYQTRVDLSLSPL